MARARNKKGQFIKGSSRRSGGAIVKYRSAPLVVRRVNVPVPVRGGGGGRRRGSAGGGSDATVMKDNAMGGAILGYVKKNYSAQTYDKVPDVKGSKNAAIGIGAYLLKPKNPWLRRIGRAAAAIGAYELMQGDLLAGDDDASW